MRAAIGLGSNVGDRAAWMRFALAQLSHAGQVEAVSRFHETEPVGGPPQPRYLNAAAVILFEGTPRALLDGLRRIENAAGRVRDIPWGPRTLDLDLLLCDSLVVQEAGLVVPHPRLRDRRFVLEPLAEIAPEWVVPGCGRTVRQLLEDLLVGR